MPSIRCSRTGCAEPLSRSFSTTRTMPKRKFSMPAGRCCSSRGVRAILAGIGLLVLSGCSGQAPALLTGVQKEPARIVSSNTEDANAATVVPASSAAAQPDAAAWSSRLPRSRLVPLSRCPRQRQERPAARPAPASMTASGPRAEHSPYRRHRPRQSGKALGRGLLRPLLRAGPHHPHAWHDSSEPDLCRKSREGELSGLEAGELQAIARRVS